MSWTRNLCVLLALGIFAPSAWAHLGSKDVFETVDSGPYHLAVTVRPPLVIPGVATVEVQASGPAVTELRITPIPLTGEASKHPPSSDRMTQSPNDPAFFNGGVWMMASGSWRVRFEIVGAAGPSTASVAVPAMAISTLHMQPAMGWGLGVLGLFLLISMAGLVAAAVREARLPPGVEADAPRRRRSVLAMGFATAVMALMVWGGAKWWNVEAASYAENVYRPLATTAALTGDVLDLRVAALPPDSKDPRRHPGRSNRDFLPDHGKLIHLYAIRQPQMDAAFHLHPDLVAPGDFRMILPAMPPGQYTLYGDVVHASGFPETLVARLVVQPGLTPAALAQDDAQASPQPLSAGALGPGYHLPDGYTMLWDKPVDLTAGTAYRFRFKLLAPDGRPATHMQSYLGMAGHAAFVKTDGTVFAHTHPEGSAAMAAMDLANGGMTPMSPVGPQVDFPYGFPSPGQYRIFVQMKHDTTVETGVFDATVR